MMTMRRTLMIVGAVALTLVIAVTAVVAGGPTRGSAAPPAASASPTPATAANEPIAAMPASSIAGIETLHFLALGGPGQGGDLGARCEEFARNLAANLGVTTDQLGAAVKKTLIQEIDAAQAAGRLTPEQAQAARDRINSNTGSLCAGLGAAGKPAARGRGGMAFGVLDGDLLDATAKFFGISADQLKQDLRDARSLQGVAAKYGKDTPTGKADLQRALEAALRSSLAARGLEAAQVDRVVAAFNQGFERLYTLPIGDFGRGGPGGHPGFGPGVRSPRPSATPAATQ
jgi:hypothetical protein